MAPCDLEPTLALYGDINEPLSIELAAKLKLSLKPVNNAPSSWHLCVTRDELSLVGPEGDQFTLGTTDIERRSAGFVRSGLAKACAASRMPRILDALSGWGSDGLALSVFGCEVVCCEINPLVCTLSRVRADKMGIGVEFVQGDAFDVIANSIGEFDVVYLDAMFPIHPKGARPSKSLQVLASLAASCDLNVALGLARQAAKDRVVVKQRRNQRLDLPAPDWSVEGKTVRFDVYRTLLK